MWFLTFARCAGVHYNHCVSPSVRQICFPCIFLLAPDTDQFTFTTGRAHYSQLILMCATDRLRFIFDIIYLKPLKTQVVQVLQCIYPINTSLIHFVFILTSVPNVQERFTKT